MSETSGTESEYDEAYGDDDLRDYAEEAYNRNSKYDEAYDGDDDLRDDAEEAHNRNYCDWCGGTHDEAKHVDDRAETPTFSHALRDWAESPE